MATTPNGADLLVTLAKLVALYANTRHPVRSLTVPITVLGRGRGSDIFLGSSTVSKCHAILLCDGDHFMLRDLASREGTFVNGRSITEEVLQDDDKIKIGRFRFRLDLDGVEQVRDHRLVQATLVGPVGDDQIELDRTITVVGSREGCDLQLIDGEISRVNSILLRTSMGLFIRDLDSRAGTIVNGQSVRLAKLSTGDRIQVGPFTLEVLINEPGSREAMLGEVLPLPARPRLDAQSGTHEMVSAEREDDDNLDVPDEAAPVDEPPLDASGVVATDKSPAGAPPASDANTDRSTRIGLAAQASRSPSPPPMVTAEGAAELARGWIELREQQAELERARRTVDERRISLRTYEAELEHRNAQIDAERLELHELRTRLNEQMQMLAANVEEDADQPQPEADPSAEQTVLLEQREHELSLRAESLDQREAQLEQRLADAAGREAALNQRAAELEQRGQQLAAQQTALDARIEELDAHAAGLAQRDQKLNEARSAFQQQSAERETLAAQLADLQARLDAESADRNNRLQQLDQLQTALDQALQRAADAENALNTLEDAAGLNQQQQERYDAQLQELHAQLGELHTLLEQRMADLDAKEGQIRSLRDRLAAGDATLANRVKELEAELQQAREQLEQRDRQIAELSSTTSGIALADADVAREIDQARTEIEKHYQELEEWARQLQAKEAELQDFEKKLEPLSETQISDRQRQLLISEQELSDRQASFNEREADVNLRYERLAAERELVESKFEELANRLDEVGQREQMMIDRIRAEQLELTRQRELIERESSELNKRIKAYLKDKKEFLSRTGANVTTGTISLDKAPAKPAGEQPPGGTVPPVDKSGVRGGFWFNRRKDK